LNKEKTYVDVKSCLKTLVHQTVSAELSAKYFNYPETIRWHWHENDAPTITGKYTALANQMNHIKSLLINN
jgi:hypothetical protein